MKKEIKSNAGRGSSPLPHSSLPQYTGKYFAICNGEPVILTFEETYALITYDGGEIDPFYFDDDHGIESWVAVEEAFRPNNKNDTPPDSGTNLKL